MQRVLKWIGIGLGVLLALVVVAGVVVFALGSSRLNREYNVGEPFTIPTSPEAVARGDYLMHAVQACAGCHGEGLRGELFFDNEPPFGTMAAPNLTTGAGGQGGMTPDQWERAIRHGVGQDGRVLLIMPSHHYNSLSDEDLGALLAYIQTLPPVDNVLPARNLSPLANLLGGAGMLGQMPAELIDHDAGHAATVPAEVTAAYGEYLSHLSACYDCHGANLDGVLTGGAPSAVPPPDITSAGAVGGWTSEQFVSTMRSGVTPDGRPLSPEMPWQMYGRMTDEDLTAMHLFLTSLP
jgi:mono/diheme cytochrome c family protein